MAEQMRPASNAQAPDPSDSYERSHPEHEAGAGRLDNNTNATPRSKPDQMPHSVGNAQDGSKQLNAHENKQAGTNNPKHSMQDEEPLGWDQAPQGGGSAQRHPRTGGKGGTPDVGESGRNG